MPKVRKLYTHKHDGDFTLEKAAKRFLADILDLSGNIDSIQYDELIEHFPNLTTETAKELEAEALKQFHRIIDVLRHQSKMINR